MGKVHALLAHAGKVIRGQTPSPKVVKQDKKKPRGRAHKRMQYNRFFVSDLITIDSFDQCKNRYRSNVYN
ncbi:hypothetical protein QQ045_029825 [Rhodiola kirilowii]